LPASCAPLSSIVTCPTSACAVAEGSVMRVDRKWVERNLGYDPIAKPPPDTTFDI
jgi:hypothetical protein